MASTFARSASPQEPRWMPGQRVQPWLNPTLLLFGATVAFFLFAAAVLLPQSGAGFGATPAKPVTPQTAGTTAAPALTSNDLETVFSYARQMRPDDELVEVRPSVFAKRSNVHGVQVGGQTLYYEILPHQSFGPLRSGKVTQEQIHVLGREQTPSAIIIVYSIGSPRS